MVFEYLITLLESIGPEKIVFGDDISVEGVNSNAEVKIKAGSEGRGAYVTRREVVLYPSQFGENAYAHYEELVREGKRELGAVKRSDASQDSDSLKEVDYEYIENITNFYEGLLSDNHINLLKRSLYLREVKEHPDLSLTKDIDESKSDLANDHGYEAYYFTHLVSSGYFDEDRFFQNMYNRLSEEEGPTDEQYWDEFEKIVGEKLIAVFVNEDNNTYELKTDIKSRVAKHYMHRPLSDFIDICGMGYKCELTIDEAITNLKEEYDSLDIEDNDRGREKVIRLYPASLRGGVLSSI